MHRQGRAGWSTLLSAVFLYTLQAKPIRDPAGEGLTGFPRGTPRRSLELGINDLLIGTGSNNPGCSPAGTETGAPQKDPPQTALHRRTLMLDHTAQEVPRRTISNVISLETKTI